MSVGRALSRPPNLKGWKTLRTDTKGIAFFYFIKMELQKSLPTQLPKLRFLDRFMENHKGYIAGGCFKNLFLGEKIKDVDIFFHVEQDAKEAETYFSINQDFSKAWKSDRVSAFRCKKTGIVCELIFAHLSEPETMISGFDFTITKAFYCKGEEGAYEFYHHPRFFEHLTNRKLVIDDKIPFPLSTFNRSFRYKGYGFGLCGESKERLIQSLQGIENINQNDFYFGID